MKTTPNRARLAGLLLAATAYTAFQIEPAYAQTKLINIPADKYAIAPVALTCGRGAMS
jgi:hypothetical protein